MEKLSCIKTTGEISVEPCGKVRRQFVGNETTIIIMGPTGSGKSSFIEALAGTSQALEISKNQLAGYTQTVTAYKVVNTLLILSNSRQQLPIYLVDTPGFADSKISEREIVQMVLEWMKANGVPEWFSEFTKILYFIPINDIRLAGTKRRTIEMLTSFLWSSKNLSSVTFVTTFWDSLNNERMQQRGESNLAELRDQHLERFLSQGAKIVRFMATRQSALEILNLQAVAVRTNYRDVFAGAPNLYPHLYQDLYNRIDNALQVNNMIEAELAQVEAQTNEELNTILKKNLRENRDTLYRFIGHFEGLRPSSCIDPDAPSRLRRKISDFQRKRLQDVRCQRQLPQRSIPLAWNSLPVETPNQPVRPATPPTEDLGRQSVPKLKPDVHQDCVSKADEQLQGQSEDIAIRNASEEPLYTLFPKSVNFVMGSTSPPRGFENTYRSRRGKNTTRRPHHPRLTQQQRNHNRYSTQQVERFRPLELEPEDLGAALNHNTQFITHSVMPISVAEVTHDTATLTLAVDVDVKVEHMEELEEPVQQSDRDIIPLSTPEPTIHEPDSISSDTIEISAPVVRKSLPVPSQQAPINKPLIHRSPVSSKQPPAAASNSTYTIKSPIFSQQSSGEQKHQESAQTLDSELITQRRPSRMAFVKALPRRFLTAARRIGKKWFGSKR